MRDAIKLLVQEGGIGRGPARALLQARGSSASTGNGPMGPDETYKLNVDFLARSRRTRRYLSKVDYDIWLARPRSGRSIAIASITTGTGIGITGNGDIGNQGTHHIARWGLNKQEHPRRRLQSAGGRFAPDDGQETPNTQTSSARVRRPHTPSVRQSEEFTNDEARRRIDCSTGPRDGCD